MVVNIYLKAAAVTLLVFIAWFVASMYLDVQRNTLIEQNLEDALLELESTKVLFLYADQAEDTNALCTAIDSKLESQLDLMQELVVKLDTSSKSDLTRDTYVTLKKRFVIANAEALYYLDRLEALCQTTKINQVLFFYQEEGACPECDAQGRILDSIRDHCDNVRIFPFPVDTDVEVINLLREEYGVTTAPSVIIGGRLYEGVHSIDELSQGFECHFDG